jgi:hypothetical protein
MEKMTRQISGGLLLAIGVGVALGVALDNIAIGIGVGVALGAAFIARRKKQANDERTS